MKLALTVIFSLATLNVYGDNPGLLRANESSFVFDDGTRVSMKRDKIGDLDTVDATVQGKTIKITKTDLGEVRAPRINSVNLTHPQPDKWELTISYGSSLQWNTFSEITICFGEGGFVEKRLKIPTGKDTWIYKRQKAGMAEEDDGHGSMLPAIE